MILYPNAGWPTKNGTDNKCGKGRTTIVPDKVIKTTTKSGSGNNTTKK
jgi:hypothetical protein